MTGKKFQYGITLLEGRGIGMELFDLKVNYSKILNNLYEEICSNIEKVKKELEGHSAKTEQRISKIEEMFRPRVCF